MRDVDKEKANLFPARSLRALHLPHPPQHSDTTAMLTYPTIHATCVPETLTWACRRETSTSCSWENTLFWTTTYPLVTFVRGFNGFAIRAGSNSKIFRNLKARKVPVGISSTEKESPCNAFYLHRRFLGCQSVSHAHVDSFRALNQVLSESSSGHRRDQLMTPTLTVQQIRKIVRSQALHLMLARLLQSNKTSLSHNTCIVRQAINTGRQTNECRMDWKYLVHITKNLPSNIFATGFLMIKNTGGSCLNEYH
jgi:hypothetical protein